jgi:integrase
VRDVAPAHIQQFISHLLQFISANTVHRYLANISKCLESAVKQNIIAYNPVKRVDLPKKIKYKGAKFYNEQQINELLERSKGDPLEIVILLAVFYGLRRSEVAGIKWDAVDFLNNTITIRNTVVPVNGVLHFKESTKNDASFAILPMPKMIRNRLLDWRYQQAEYQRLQPNDYVESDYVCTHINGELIKPDYISQHFTILLRNIGMPHIRFHDVRHSSASFLLSLGFSMKEIQVWLRHGDIQTTMNIYTHLDMTAKMGIAESLNEKLNRYEVGEASTAVNCSRPVVF